MHQAPEAVLGIMLEDVAVIVRIATGVQLRHPDVEQLAGNEQAGREPQSDVRVVTDGHFELRECCAQGQTDRSG